MNPPTNTLAGHLYAVRVGDGLAGASHTGGRDPITYFGARLLNHVIHRLDHAVDIVATPVGKGHVYTAVVPFLIVAGTAVGGDAIGIEVVVI